jgi:hypothetical protein
VPELLSVTCPIGVFWRDIAFPIEDDDAAVSTVCDGVRPAGHQMIGARGSYGVDRDFRYEAAPKWLDLGKLKGP